MSEPPSQHFHAAMPAGTRKGELEEIEEMDESQLQALIDRNAIIDTMSRYATGLDQRDAATYRSCFTDELEVHIGDAEPRRCSADEWASQAFAAVGMFQSTQHIITNHVVSLEGEKAECVAYLQAQHFNPDKALMVGGYYTNRLVREARGWRISSLKLTITWTQSG